MPPRFTFNAGTNFIFGIKDPLLFIETGIYFLDRGCVEKGRTNQYTVLQSNGTYTLTSDIYLHRYYLSLPVLFRVEMAKFYVSFGPTFDYYLCTRIVWTREINRIAKYSHSQGRWGNFKIGFDINIGRQFRLFDKLFLFVEGSFNPGEFLYLLNKKWLYNINYEIGTGLTYKLK